MKGHRPVMRRRHRLRVPVTLDPDGTPIEWYFYLVPLVGVSRAIRTVEEVGQRGSYCGVFSYRRR